MHRSATESPSAGIRSNLEPFGTHFRNQALPALPALPPEVVAATSARTLPSTRAGGQDDGS